MTIHGFVYIATSVDGYIAAPDGGIEWLERPEYHISKLNGLGYDEFISKIDAIIMGRNSYEKVLTFGLEQWPYEGTPVIVLTSRDLQIPDPLEGKVTTDSGEPDAIATRLEAAGHRNIYVDGGETISRFLEAGLIHEITITRIPLLLGAGIRLFREMEKETPLRLIEATTSNNGFVQERYRVEPASS